MTKGIIIAAPESGAGKTLFTLALLRHLKNDRVRVSSAKIGPDYIDPAFHSIATKKPCFNFDTWAMREETLNSLLKKLSEYSDLIVVEGVMGLFDGALGEKSRKDGSTASWAEKTGWPIVLVIDASAQAQSVAALVRGFITHNEKLNICGVVFNKVGGLGHKEILAQAVKSSFPEIKIFGFLSRNIEMELPQRYLGLEQVLEHHSIDDFMDRAATWLARSVDVDSLVSMAKFKTYKPSKSAILQIKPLGQRIAVAQDKAFAFAYNSLLQGWSEAGAQVIPFSPLAGEAPSKFADSVYLPGGYPELFAAELSESGFNKKLRKVGELGIRIFGECGGYMVLGTGIIDKSGNRFEMSGLLPLETSLENSSLHLGYRRVRTLASSPLGRKGCEFKGHEFHYANVISEAGEGHLFVSTNARGDSLGKVGMTNGTIAGSFIHLIDQCGG